MKKFTNEKQKITSLKKWAIKFSAKTRRHIEKTKKFKEMIKIQNAAEQLESDHLFNFHKIRQSATGYLYYLTDHEIYKTTLDSFLSAKDSWHKTFNTLSANIEKEFSLKGIIEHKHQGKTLALAYLSKLGSDRAIIREIDYKTKRLTPDGFSIPFGRNDVIWLSHDKLIGAVAFDENALTTSQYPKNIYILKRGDTAKNAEKIFSIPESHMFIYPIANLPHAHYVVFLDSIDFYSNAYYFFETTTKKCFHFPIPTHAEIKEFSHNDVYVHITKDWVFNQSTVFKNNSILRINLKNLIKNKFSTLLSEDIFTCITLQENELFRKIIVSTNDTAYVFFHHNYEINIIKMKKSQGETSIEPIFKSHPYADLSYALIDKKQNLIFKIATLLIPDHTYAYSSNTGKTRVISSCQPHFEPTDYVLKKKDISHQGVTISYHYVFKKGLKFNGKNPVILNGYGGFNRFDHPGYLQAKGKILLNEGFVLAYAHIRGGGELGEAMHLDGIAQKKQNSFDDFIAIAKDLIDTKITSPRFLGIEGGSNGGLLVATCMTQRPDLFGAVFCDSGPLDMLHYHEMLAGKMWLAEYGNPENPSDRKILAGYSPLEHVTSDKPYPPIMLQTATTDDRVDPTHSRAMAKALSNHKQPMLYIEEKAGGHEAVTLTALARKYTFWHQKLLAPAKRAREEETMNRSRFFSNEAPVRQKRRTESRQTI